MVMATTVVVSLAAGMAFSPPLQGLRCVFHVERRQPVHSSILVSLGVGLLFNELGLDPIGIVPRSAAQLTWTLRSAADHVRRVQPFQSRVGGSGARQGATPWQSFWHVVLPIIAPSVIGIALFGFTLSYDEFARTLLTAAATTPCRWRSSA